MGAGQSTQHDFEFTDPDAGLEEEFRCCSQCFQLFDRGLPRYSISRCVRGHRVCQSCYQFSLNMFGPAFWESEKCLSCENRGVYQTQEEAAVRPEKDEDLTEGAGQSKSSTAGASTSKPGPSNKNRNKNSNSVPAKKSEPEPEINETTHCTVCKQLITAGPQITLDICGHNMCMECYNGLNSAETAEDWGKHAICRFCDDPWPKPKDSPEVRAFQLKLWERGFVAFLLQQRKDMDSEILALAARWQATIKNPAKREKALEAELKELRALMARKEAAHIGFMTQLGIHKRFETVMKEHANAANMLRIVNKEMISRLSANEKNQTELSKKWQDEKEGMRSMIEQLNNQLNRVQEESQSRISELSKQLCGALAECQQLLNQKEETTKNVSYNRTKIVIDKIPMSHSQDDVVSDFLENGENLIYWEDSPDMLLRMSGENSQCCIAYLDNIAAAEKVATKWDGAVLENQTITVSYTALSKRCPAIANEALKTASEESPTKPPKVVPTPHEPLPDTDNTRRVRNLLTSVEQGTYKGGQVICIWWLKNSFHDQKLETLFANVLHGLACDEGRLKFEQMDTPVGSMLFLFAKKKKSALTLVMEIRKMSFLDAAVKCELYQQSREVQDLLHDKFDIA
ncbi:unnamed protein product, partial [Mesorhabditis spiculigera]